MEKLPELKLFTHIAQAQDEDGKIIEALDAGSAGKLGRGDEDIAIVQLNAMLAAAQKLAARSEDDSTALLMVPIMVITRQKNGLPSRPVNGFRTPSKVKVRYLTALFS